MNWSDDVRIGYLYNALNARLLQGLVGAAPCATYNEFCSQLRLIEEQLNRAQRATRIANHRTTITTTTTSKSGDRSNSPTAMDWEATKVAAVRLDKEPRRRATRVSQEEVERRRTNRLCIRCAAPDHFIANCSFLPPESTQRTQRVQRTKSRPTGHVLTVEESDDDVVEEVQPSGKA